MDASKSELWRREELTSSTAGRALGALYERLGCDRHWRVGRIVMDAILRTERGAYRSLTARELLARFHQVRVGSYSYGECMLPGVFPRGVEIGRYVSVAKGVRVYTQNHPLDRLSMHPFFYDPRLGLVEHQALEPGSLWIGHDCWIGSGAIVTPACNRIGVGAVVAAGAVVTRDVADFAVVAGNPARELRRRFEPGICERILESRWWERSIEDVAAELPSMLEPLASESIATHPLLAQRGPEAS